MVMADLARRMLCGAAGFVLMLAVPVVAVAQVPVTVTTAKKQDVPIWLRGLGTVQAYYSVQLRPRVDGTLMQVPVTEGQDVKQGDLLAVIDPRPYQALLDAALAKRQQDQAQLANAQADLARYASLVRQDFASRQQLETQAATVKQMSATVTGDEAQIEAAQLNLSFCYITAPFDGRVGLRNVDPGNIVRSTEPTPIVSLTQIQPDCGDVHPAAGQPAADHARRWRRASWTSWSYAGDNKTELDHGTLLTPDNTIDAGTGTIKLKAVFPNQRNSSVAGAVRQCLAAAGHRQRVLAVRDDGGAAWAGRAVRLHRGRQQRGLGAADQGRAGGRRRVDPAASGLEDGAVVVADRSVAAAGGFAGERAWKQANRPEQNRGSIGNAGGMSQRGNGRA